MTAALALAAALLLPLLVLSGFISGSETALFGLNHAARAKLRRESPRIAHAVGELLDRPRPLLTALLATNILVNVTYFSVSSIIVVQLEGDGHNAAAAGLAVGSLIAIILLGEIGAKLVASTFRVQFCRLVAGPWLLVVRIAWPILSRTDRMIISPLVRVVGSPTSPSRVVRRSSDTLAGVLSNAVEVPDTESASDQRLILQVMRLGRTRAREAMLPRSRTSTVTEDEPHDRIMSGFEQATSLLVLDKEERSVLGWLHAPVYLASPPTTETHRLRPLAEPPVYVPEQSTLDAALAKIRSEARDRAVVVDELGEFVGVLRIEDIAAQLLEDQFVPASHHADEPRLIGLGRFAVPGRWPARAILVDLDIPHDEAERILARVSTAAGLMLALIGKMPEAGDTATLPGAVMQITEVDGREILTIEIQFTETELPGTP